MLMHLKAGGSPREEAVCSENRKLGRDHLPLANGIKPKERGLANWNQSKNINLFVIPKSSVQTDF